MIQDNLYLFEVEIAHCSISIQQEGQFSLFLRIGKTTSSFLKAKSYYGKVMVFDSVIRCNCDQSALDTKRFSLTLNMKTSNKENKVLGIAMIPLQSESSTQHHPFKINQCSDPDATIQLKYSVNMIGGNSDISKKSSGLSFSLTTKKTDDNKMATKELKISSVKASEKRKQNGRFLDVIFTTPTLSRLPISQFVQDVNTLQKQDFHSKNEEIAQLKEINAQLSKQNEKLKREKAFLKELVKIETSKNNVSSNFLEKFYPIFVEQRISDALSVKKLDRQTKEDLPSKQKLIDEAKNKLFTSVSSIAQNSTITPITQKGQKQRFQIDKNDNKKGSDSKISFSKISGINEDLKNLLKESITKEREESKNTIELLRKALMDESELKHERRLRSVKIKVDKSYLELFKQPQPYTKEHIMKQKIHVKKILDELVMCTITP